jgi:hypothetical protein
MRSVEEIDAEISKLKEIKNQQEYGVPTRLTPEYRAGRFDYIVGGDRSGLDAYQQAVNSAVNNKLQRDFQDRQRLANEAFQSIENDKNRAVQQKQADHEKVMDKAKLLKAARDSQAIVDDAAKNTGKYTAVEIAKAKNQRDLDLQLMADSGLFTAEELSKFEVGKPDGAGNTGLDDDEKNPRIEVSDLKASVKNAKTLDDIKTARETLAGLDKNEYNADELNAIETDLNKKEEDIKKSNDAKAQKDARLDEGRKHKFSKNEVRKLLGINSEGGGKNEAEATYSYEYNGKTFEAKGKWIRNDKQAKLVVDGVTVQVIDLF